MSPEDIRNVHTQRGELDSDSHTVCACVRVCMFTGVHMCAQQHGYRYVRIMGLSESGYKYGNAAAIQQPHTVASHQSQSAAVGVT